MIHWLQHLLVSEDDKDPNFIRLLRIILGIVLVFLLLIAFAQSGILFGSLQSDILAILTLMAIITGVCIYLLSKDVLWPGKLFIPFVMLIAITYFVSTANGLHDVAVSGYPAILLFSSLVLGRRTLLFWAIATSACIGFVGYWDMAGFTPEPIARTTGIDTILIGILVIAGSAGIVNVLLNRFEDIISIARRSETEQIEANYALRKLQSTMEQRIDERTAELKKRASQLEAIASVARSTAALQNLEELLPAITKLVSEGFGYYHAGIFLLDENHEFALLRAANSEGGQRMLSRQHKLKVDTNSIVGYVTSSGKPRIALDVGTDAVYFNTPELRDTRSEMALPLRVGGNIIGALDVQSIEANAFTQNDIDTLSTLADQVAIAIENARLFSESQESLKKSEETFTQYIKQEWSGFARRAKTSGYKFDGTRTIHLSTEERRKKLKQIPNTGSLSLDKETQILSIPIRFRGQTIGILEVKPKSGNRKWTSDDIALLEAATERTALALENARLIASSQMQASRERTIGEISSRIAAASNIDAIMQAAVEELGRRIGGAAEVTLELDTEGNGQLS